MLNYYKIVIPSEAEYSVGMTICFIAASRCF